MTVPDLGRRRKVTAPGQIARYERSVAEARAKYALALDDLPATQRDGLTIKQFAKKWKIDLKRFQPWVREDPQRAAVYAGLVKNYHGGRPDADGIRRRKSAVLEYVTSRPFPPDRLGWPHRLVSLTSVRRWKELDPQFAAAVAASAADRRREIQALVLAAINAGRTLKEINADPALPGEWMIWRWRDSDAGFAGRYRSAQAVRIQALLADRQTGRDREILTEKNQRATAKAAGRISRGARSTVGSIRANVGELLQGQLFQNAIYAAADRALSKAIDPDVRSDIITDITIAVLEGEIAFDDISDQADFYRKEQARVFGSRNIASLDEQLFGDGAATRMEYLRVDPLYAE